MLPNSAHYLFLFMFIGVMKLKRSSSIQHPEGRRMLKYVNPVVDHGNSSFIPGITVFAAVVQSYNSKEVHCSDAICPFVTNETVITSRRKLIQSSIYIPLVYWRFINAKSCPHHSPHSHKLDKGLSISHMQVWSDFAFFDRDTDEARFRPKPEYLISNSWSSVSGIFQAFENGTRLKNNLPYLDEDILLIFEDGVYSAQTFSQAALTTDLTTIFHSHLSRNRQPIDLLLLGNCTTTYEKVNAHHRHSLCPFAYAITRRAAAKLTEYLDICGQRFDQQLAHLATHGLIHIKWSHHPHFVIGA